MALQGFLSAQLSLPQLIGFGLSLFAKSSNAARLNLLSKGLPGLVVMLSRLAVTVGYEGRIQKDAKKWALEDRKPEEKVTAPPP